LLYYLVSHQQQPETDVLVNLGIVSLHPDPPSGGMHMFSTSGFPRRSWIQDWPWKSLEF